MLEFMEGFGFVDDVVVLMKVCVVELIIDLVVWFWICLV